MVQLPWLLILALASSGVPMALLSCLVGMRPKLEIPLWWGLYGLWILIALLSKATPLFWTLLLSSALAGLLHGSTTALLLDQYMLKNPWHAQSMSAAKPKLRVQFVVMGIVIGTVFGIVIAGIGWLVQRVWPM